MARRFTARARPVNRHWTGIAGSFFAHATASNAAVNINPAVHGQETILRTRGEVWAFVNDVQAPTSNLVQVALGLIVMPGGSGTTVTSSPITDADAPWFWYDTFVLGYEEMVTDVIDVPGITSYRGVIDSKAMRIIRSDREIQLVIESATLGGSGLAVNAGIVARLLSQE